MHPSPTCGVIRGLLEVRSPPHSGAAPATAVQGEDTFLQYRPERNSSFVPETSVTLSRTTSPPNTDPRQGKRAAMGRPESENKDVRDTPQPPNEWRLETCIFPGWWGRKGFEPSTYGLRVRLTRISMRR